MDITQLLTLQITAHLLTDFTFQPDKNAREKNNNGFRSKFLKWHILITFAISWLLSFQLKFVLASIVIAILHWIVDGLKKHIQNNKIIGKYAFFIDQFLHLFFITLIVWLFSLIFELNPVFSISFNTKYLLVIASIVLCTKPSNIIVKEIFNVFEIYINGKDDLPNAGKLIGIVERMLVLAFIIINQFQAVGFLIAAKSILRFKNDETIKTEYVLIGTMLSFGIAIGAGTIACFIK